MDLKGLKANLTLDDYRILKVIQNNDGLRANEIAAVLIDERKLAIQKGERKGNEHIYRPTFESTVNIKINSMTRLGLLKKSKDAFSYIVISLTDEGLNAISMFENKKKHNIQIIDADEFYYLQLSSDLKRYRDAMFTLDLFLQYKDILLVSCNNYNILKKIGAYNITILIKIKPRNEIQQNLIEKKYVFYKSGKIFDSDNNAYTVETDGSNIFDEFERYKYFGIRSIKIINICNELLAVYKKHLVNYRFGYHEYLHIDKILMHAESAMLVAHGHEEYQRGLVFKNSVVINGVKINVIKGMAKNIDDLRMYVKYRRGRFEYKIKNDANLYTMDFELTQEDIDHINLDINIIQDLITILKAYKLYDGLLERYKKDTTYMFKDAHSWINILQHTSSMHCTDMIVPLYDYISIGIEQNMLPDKIYNYDGFAYAWMNLKNTAKIDMTKVKPEVKNKLHNIEKINTGNFELLL